MVWVIGGFAAAGVGVVILLYGIIENEEGPCFLGVIVGLVGFCIGAYSYWGNHLDPKEYSAERFEVYKLGDNGYTLFYWHKDKRHRIDCSNEDSERMAVFKHGIRDIRIKTEKDRAGNEDMSSYELYYHGDGRKDSKSDSSVVDTSKEDKIIMRVE